MRKELLCHIARIIGAVDVPGGAIYVRQMHTREVIIHQGLNKHFGKEILVIATVAQALEAHQIAIAVHRRTTKLGVIGEPFLMEEILKIYAKDAGIKINAMLL